MVTSRQTRSANVKAFRSALATHRRLVKHDPPRLAWQPKLRKFPGARSDRWGKFSALLRVFIAIEIQPMHPVKDRLPHFQRVTRLVSTFHLQHEHAA